MKLSDVNLIIFSNIMLHVKYSKPKKHFVFAEPSLVPNTLQLL